MVVRSFIRGNVGPGTAPRRRIAKWNVTSLFGPTLPISPPRRSPSEQSERRSEQKPRNLVARTRALARAEPFKTSLLAPCASEAEGGPALMFATGAMHARRMYVHSAIIYLASRKC